MCTIPYCTALLLLALLQTIPYCKTHGNTAMHPTPPPPRLASPCLASLCLTLLHLTSPHLTPPHFTSPHLTSPHLASPRHPADPILCHPPPYRSVDKALAPAFLQKLLAGIAPEDSGDAEDTDEVEESMP